MLTTQKIALTFIGILANSSCKRNTILSCSEATKRRDRCKYPIISTLGHIASEWAPWNAESFHSLCIHWFPCCACDCESESKISSFRVFLYALHPSRHCHSTDRIENLEDFQVIHKTLSKRQTSFVIILHYFYFFSSISLHNKHVYIPYDKYNPRRSRMRLLLWWGGAQVGSAWGVERRWRPVGAAGTPSPLRETR